MKRMAIWVIGAFLIGSLASYIIMHQARYSLWQPLSDAHAACMLSQQEGSSVPYNQKSCDELAIQQRNYNDATICVSLAIAILLSVAAGAWRLTHPEEETYDGNYDAYGIPQDPEPKPLEARTFPPNAADPRAFGSAPIPGGQRHMTPIDIGLEDGPDVALESREEQVQKTADFGRPHLAETQLMERLQANPSDLAARYELLEIYIDQNREDLARRAARELIKALIGVNEANRAYDLYRRLGKRLGKVPLGVRALAGLVEQRLSMRDTDSALELFEQLYGQDPNFNKLPQLLCQLVRLLVKQHGPQSAIARKWYAECVQRFGHHPEISALVDEMSELNADGASMGVTADMVRQMIHSHQYGQAVSTLISESELVAEIDPLDLYPLAQKLAIETATLPKAVMLMELIVRKHLEHPGTPELVQQLIELYLTRLNQRKRAESWAAYLLKRWPNSQEAARVREMVKTKNG